MQIIYINENKNKIHLKIHIKVIQERENKNEQNTTYNRQMLLHRKCI